jgi:hypothetical protein
MAMVHAGDPKLRPGIIKEQRFLAGSGCDATPAAEMYFTALVHTGSDGLPVDLFKGDPT